MLSGNPEQIAVSISIAGNLTYEKMIPLDNRDLYKLLPNTLYCRYTTRRKANDRIALLSMSTPIFASAGHNSIALKIKVLAML